MDGLDWLTDAGAILWVVLGLLLVGLEIVLPGTFMLWFGLAALATGGLHVLASLLGADIPAAAQFVIFAALAAVAVYEGRRRLSRAEDSDDPTLNRGAARLIGSRHTLGQPITGGRGRLKVGDSWWSVDGPDLPAGSAIEIVGVNGTRLAVAPVPRAD